MQKKPDTSKEIAYLCTYPPKKEKGKPNKFAHSFYDPYRVIELTANDTKVNKPHRTPIFVTLEWVCHCRDELPPDQSWCPVHEHSADTVADSTSDNESVESWLQDTIPTWLWKGPQPCEDAWI